MAENTNINTTRSIANNSTSSPRIVDSHIETSSILENVSIDSDPEPEIDPQT